MEIRIPSRIVQQASLQVRWCIDKQEQERIASRPPEEKAFVLLVGVHLESRKEVRCLAPANDVFQHIAFPQPGIWRLFAGVISEQLGEGSRYFTLRGKLKDQFLSEDVPGHYRSSLFSEEGVEPFLFSWMRSPFVIPPETGVDVEVPAELFAKEPPVWERRWVTKFWKSPIRDQCDYRRRRIFAYTVQPVLYILFAFFLGVVFIAGLVSAFARWLWNLGEVSPKEKLEEDPEKKERVRLQRLASTELLLACDTPLERVRLPRKARIRLFYAGVKNKVCLPMAR